MQLGAGLEFIMLQELRKLNKLPLQTLIIEICMSRNIHIKNMLCYLLRCCVVQHRTSGSPRGSLLGSRLPGGLSHGLMRGARDRLRIALRTLVITIRSFVIDRRLARKKKVKYCNKMKYNN